MVTDDNYTKLCFKCTNWPLQVTFEQFFLNLRKKSLVLEKKKS